MNYSNWTADLFFSFLICLMWDRLVIDSTLLHPSDRTRAKADINRLNRDRGKLTSLRVRQPSKSASFGGNTDKRQLNVRSPARKGFQRAILATKAGATVTSGPGGEMIIAPHQTSIPPPIVGGPSVATTAAKRTTTGTTSAALCTDGNGPPGHRFECATIPTDNPLFCCGPGYHCYVGQCRCNIPGCSPIPGV